MMRGYLFPFCFLLLGIAVKAQTAKPVVVDGPYVSYHDGRIYAANILKDDDLLLPVIDFYPDTQKAIMLKVVPEGHQEWAFKEKLKPAIENEASVYPQSEKTLFISDIEGEFAGFRKLLIAAKVMDEGYNWTYGANTLVIPGDLFDRGKDVVPELWLLYKLEDEAKAAGGSLQVILGNHVIMNLTGDHRYTDGKYFKNAWLLKTNCTQLFGRDTELGRWLRSKNIIEKTGNVLVMHGGLSPEILGKKQSVDQMNTECRPYYDAVRRQIPDSLQVFFGPKALFWYRGYFIQPKISMAQLDSTLAFYHCRYILVGHTIVKWNIASYYGGKVVSVDVDEHKGQTAAALYEKGKWYRMDDKGKTKKLVYQTGNDEIKETDIL